MPQPGAEYSSWRKFINGGVKVKESDAGLLRAASSVYGSICALSAP